uniref:Uncharacterized protein n=1 Tax=Hucho hucho TaxID=62062 RepID=A0A4W5PIE9_9TELE
MQRNKQKNYWIGTHKTSGAAADQKSAAKAALVHTCPVCQVNMDPKTIKLHFESKHSESPMVPLLVDVQS